MSDPDRAALPADGRAFVPYIFIAPAGLLAVGRLAMDVCAEHIPACGRPSARETWPCAGAS